MQREEKKTKADYKERMSHQRDKHHKLKILRRLGGTKTKHAFFLPPLTRMSSTRSRASSRKSIAFSRRRVGAACRRSWRAGFLPPPPKPSIAVSLTADRTAGGCGDDDDNPPLPPRLPPPPLPPPPPPPPPSNSAPPMLLLGDGLPRAPPPRNLGGILEGLDDGDGSPREACSACEACCENGRAGVCFANNGSRLFLGFFRHRCCRTHYMIYLLRCDVSQACGGVCGYIKSCVRTCPRGS